MRVWLAFSVFLLFCAPSALADGECGDRNNGSICANGMCCSQNGYCGTTAAYCCGGCQSQCNPSVCAPPPPPPPASPSPPPPPPVPTPPPPEGGGIANLISKEMFNNFFKYKDDPRCHAVGFYTYEGFIEAANFFPEFGNAGDNETRMREIAAFLGQTSHETTGGWPAAPDGPQYWGYCYKEENNKAVNCDNPTIECPCASGKMYYGRGPMQLTHNYNYCEAGKSPAINYDLLNDPDKVAEDTLMSFKTSFWFWMTEQPPKPSCHDVIIGSWVPTPADIAGNRLPGYGVITNIINGGRECGIGYDDRVDDRIKFYKRYCDEFGIEYGDNLDCYNQRPFNLGESLLYPSM